MSDSEQSNASEEEPPPYSRDEVVAEMTSFYEFLTTLHIPKVAIKYPPPGGWPHIGPNFLKTKTETVNELLRFLPYIRRDEDDIEQYQVWQQCAVLDYSTSFYVDPGEYKREDAVGEDRNGGYIPPHVVCLWRDCPETGGYWLYLDTKLGLMSICEFEYTGPRFHEDDPVPEYGLPKNYYEEVSKIFNILVMIIDLSVYRANTAKLRNTGGKLKVML
jgi:hypothetical protein